MHVVGINQFLEVHVLPAQAGSVLLEGQPLDGMPRGAVARRMGYVPQGHAAQFAFTVREAILMGRTAHISLFAAPGAADREAADRAIAALHATRIADLSGELRQQRLLLEARAQSDIGRRDLALDIISNSTGREAVRLRSDIYWAARRWQMLVALLARLRFTRLRPH